MTDISSALLPLPPWPWRTLCEEFTRAAGHLHTAIFKMGFFLKMWCGFSQKPTLKKRSEFLKWVFKSGICRKIWPYLNIDINSAAMFSWNNMVMKLWTRIFFRRGLRRCSFRWGLGCLIIFYLSFWWGIRHDSNSPRESRYGILWRMCIFFGICLTTNLPNLSCASGVHAYTPTWGYAKVRSILWLH